MLFVVSKEKIMCYVIAFSTVIILIGMAMFKSPSEESLQTLSEIRQTNNVIEHKE